MTHSFACPTCNITIRMTEELFSRKISGRRVKIACKGCQKPIVVDATTSELRVTHWPSMDAPSSVLLKKVAPPPLPPRPSALLQQGVPEASVAPSLAPLPQAPALQEEELPTLRRNEIPVDESFLPPAVAGERAPISWAGTLPPLGSAESLAALLAPAPRRDRRVRAAVLATAALCLASAGAWAAGLHIPLRTWISEGWQEERASSSDAPASKNVVPAAEGPAVIAAPEPALAGGAETALPESTPAEGSEVAVTEPTAPEPLLATPGSETKGAEPEPVRQEAMLAVARRAPSQEADVSSAPEPVAQAEHAVPAQTTSAVAAEPVAPSANSTAESGKEAVKEVAAAESDPGAIQLRPFDKAAASAALNVAEGQIGACRQAGDPSGTARVIVTFAPSGRVTSAMVSGPPFAGTPTGGCIASRFRAAQVPPFEGSFVTVTKTVVFR